MADERAATEEPAKADKHAEAGGSGEGGGRAVVERRLEAEPERVWGALTEASELAAWYWPASLAPEVSSDPVAGGRFSLRTSSPGMGFSGEYLEVDPPRRLVQSWLWAGDEHPGRVTIELSPASGEGTDLRVVHDRIDPATAERYRAGWESCLDRLPGHLAR